MIEKIPTSPTTKKKGIKDKVYSPLINYSFNLTVFSFSFRISGHIAQKKKVVIHIYLTFPIP